LPLRLSCAKARGKTGKMRNTLHVMRIERR
jgi:hypothetical protein